MKNYTIYLTTLALLLSLTAGAQELFPELGGVKSDTNSTVQVAEPTEDNVEMVEEVISEEKTIPEENPNTADEESSNEEEEPDDQKSQIILMIDNVDSTLTAIRSVSYCNMDFMVQNKTPKTIKSIAGTFSWQDHTEEFAFQDIAKNTGAATNYLMVGTVCEQLLETPDLNITTCQIEGMSPKKCKAMIKFIPISNSNTENPL